MKLEFFDAADGDCFLVTSRYRRRNYHMLVDGGRSTQFRANCLPRLAELQAANEGLHTVCVSHIDADHITGILALFEDLIEWRVFDYQRSSGNAGFPAPGPHRPPEVGRLWHNGFEAQVKDTSGISTSVLNSMASILTASSDTSMQDQAEMPAELALSIEQGVRLSRQIGEDLLGVPVNPEFAGAGDLMQLLDEPVELPRMGKARFTLLGPTKAQLEELADDWDKWVRRNETKIAAIDADAARDVEQMGLDSESMFSLRGSRASELADRNKVTVPNLASIMLLVEEGRSSALLTGDGIGDDVIAGLEAAGKLDEHGGFHANVLKVPHHGSEYNSDRRFYRRVTADHYVISANGAHHNPDLRVMDDILRSRIGRRAAETVTPQTDAPFTVWITNTPDDKSLTKSRQKYLREVRREAKAFVGNRDQVTLKFVAESGFTIEI